MPFLGPGLMTVELGVGTTGGGSGWERAENDVYLSQKLVTDMGGRPPARKGLRQPALSVWSGVSPVPEPLQVGGTWSSSASLLTPLPTLRQSPCQAQASTWSGKYLCLGQLHREDGPLSATCPAASGSALCSPHHRPSPLSSECMARGQAHLQGVTPSQGHLECQQGSGVARPWGLPAHLCLSFPSRPVQAAPPLWHWPSHLSPPATVHRAYYCPGSAVPAPARCH